MKKLLTIIILSLCFIINVDAAYLDSKSTTYVNPDGSEVTIYTTGDEYFRYTHDKAKSVIVLNEEGYYTYAKIENGKVVPSNNIYDGKTIPNKTIKVSDIDKEENKELIHEFETPNIPTISLFNGRMQTNGSNNDVLNFNNTVIFIRFKGEAEFVDADFSASMIEMFGTSNNDESSLKSYVNQVSEGNVNTESTFLQYNGTNYYSYQSSYERGYLLQYSSTNTIGYTSTDEGNKRLHKILLESISSLPATDTKNVDANGDGYIDNIIFILSGSSSGNWADVLWPHKWYLSPYYTPSNFSSARPFIYNLQFADELDISVLSHETMHSLGIIDLYRYSYNGMPVGLWDMMCNNREGTYIASIVRSLYGEVSSTNTNSWTGLGSINESGIYRLDLASTNSGNTSYLIPTSDIDQFIHLEYRGNDSSNVYDKYVPEKGLLVSRVNYSYEEYGNMGIPSGNSYIDGDLYYIYRPNESSTYGVLGGGGDLNDAAITPCTTDDCTNSIGSKDSSATIYSGALTLENGTNSEVYIRNVKEVDSDTIEFEVFLKDDNMFLSTTSYEGEDGDEFILEAICANDACPNLTYTSSDTSVVTVDNTGNVTLVGDGVAEITVTADGTTKKCTITSTSTIVESISAELIDAHNIKVEVVVDATTESVNIYKYANGDENTLELVVSGLIPDSNGKVTYQDTFEYTDFGKTYTYQASTTISNIEKFSNKEATVDTRDYLPEQVSNLKVAMTGIDKITLTFDSTPDAVGYNIYYSDNILGPYVSLDTTTATSYNFNGEFGQTYYFKVAAYKVADTYKYEGVHSEVAGVNTNEYLLNAPTHLDVTTISNTSVKLVFNEVEDASKYNIYRSTDKKNYTKIATTEDIEYTDNNVVVGNTYYYKVSATKEDLYDGYKSDAISIKVTGAAPTNLTIKNTSYSSLQITFDKMAGVDGYQIYYSTSKNGTYKKLATITSNSYTHKKLKFNKAYYYKVRSYKKVNGSTIYSNFSLVSGKKVVTSAPNVKFTPLNTSSVKLSWSKVSGATSYRIYYSTSYDGTYSLLKTVKTNNYTVKNLTFGKTYYYKVISYRNSTKGDSKISEYRVIPNAPTIKYSNNTITNSTVKNIDGYEVFKSVNNGEYVSVGNIIDNTYLTEDSTDLVKYYVKSYKLLNGEKVYSNPSNYVSNIASIGITDYSVESNGAKGALISVNGNDYVDGYYLYMATSKNGTYKKVTTSKSNEIKYNSLTPSKTYYFKVRPYVTLNGTNYLGKYSDIKTYKHTINTTNIKLSNYTYNSVKITWDKVSSATGYQIRYKEGINGTYKTITVKTNSYTHKSLKFNSDYYYQVRSYITINKKKIYSAYSEEKVIKTSLPSPTFTLENNKLGTIDLTINKVSGANGYNVYMSTDGVLYNLVDTKEEYSNLDLNQTYYFKVAATKDGVEGLVSEPKQLTTVIPKAENFVALTSTTTATEVNITWNEVTGVDGYILYLQGLPIYVTDNLSYTDKELILGKNYNYSLKAYKVVDGQTYYSEPVYTEIKQVPLKVNNITITQKMSNLSLTFTFDAIENVDGYKILRSTSANGTYTEVARCQTNNCTIYNTKLGTTYYYKVVGYTTFAGKEVNGTSSDIKSYKFIPDKISTVNTTASSITAIKVSWNKVDNVSGYELWYATSKNGKYKKYKTTTSTSATVSKLTTGKTYYFKVRSYKTVSGKKIYSSYSNIKSAYPRPKAATKLTIARYDYSSTQNKISWGKVSGASGYEVLTSTDGVNYTRLGYTTKNYYVHKKASNTKVNYYKVRAYKTVKSKKIYSEYSSVITMDTPDAPSISYYLPGDTDSSADGIFFNISNYGDKPFTILSNGAELRDIDFPHLNRTAKLLDCDTLINDGDIKYISKYVINPGSTDTIGYVFNYTTYFDKYSRFYFYFIYDGVKYRGYISSSSGSSYWEA